MGPSVSEGAIIQHLAKVRNRMTDFKLPPLRRGGAPSQYAKISETVNDSGKRATRSKKRAGDEEDFVDDDVLNHVGDDEYDSEFIDESYVDNNHVVKKAKTTNGARRAADVSSRGNRLNTSADGPDNEYIEAANGVRGVADDISEGIPKDNEDDPGSSSQGSPIALGADFLDFTSSIASSKKSTESLNSFEIGEYPEARKLVKLPLPSIGRRFPEEISPQSASTGKVGGIFDGNAAQKGCRNSGTEGMIRGTGNQMDVLHGQHGVTTTSNYEAQVISGPPTEYTPYHLQGMNIGSHGAVAGAANNLATPNMLRSHHPRNMPYPHHTQYAMNSSGFEAFMPFPSSSNTTYGQQCGINLGGSNDGIQGIQGSASHDSYGTQGISVNMRDDASWAPSNPGLGSLNTYLSPPINSFFSDATHGINSMATTDSINPNILDNASSSLGQGMGQGMGQGSYPQSSHQSTFSDFGFDGMHNYAPSTRQLSGGATNTQQSMSDIDTYLDNLSNIL